MAPTTTTPLFRLLTPLLQNFRATIPKTTIPQTSILAQTRAFSSTPIPQAMPPSRRSGSSQRIKTDPRITLIRYHLQHPLTPRPLRLSRMRALRHWTIHRAWMLVRRKKGEAEEGELYRMYQSMQSANEELRTIGTGKDQGRLFRVAQEKKGVFGHGSVPIEYARWQTDTPGREPWNHGWKREERY